MEKFKSKKQSKPNACYQNSKLRNKVFAGVCTFVIGAGAGAGAYYGIEYAINQSKQPIAPPVIEQPIEQTDAFLVPDIAEPTDYRLYNCLQEVSNVEKKLDTGVNLKLNVYLGNKVIDKVSTPIIVEQSGNSYLYANMFNSYEILNSGDIYRNFTDYANLRFQRSAYDIGKEYYKFTIGADTYYMHFLTTNVIGEHPCISSGYQVAYIEVCSDLPKPEAKIVEVQNNELEFNLELSR